MKFTDFVVDSNLHFGAFSSRKIKLSDGDGGNQIRLQIPRMYMPFGLSGFVPTEPNQQTKWNIEFALKGYTEKDNEVCNFYNFLLEIEKKTIEHICEHSVKIFGSKQSMSSLEKKFTSNMKKPSAIYEPKFRVKVDTDVATEIPKPSIFNADSKQMFEKASNALYARTTGTSIVELDSVYFMNNKFGLVWKLHQLKVFEHDKRQKMGFQFEPEEEEPEEEPEEKSEFKGGKCMFV